MAAPASALRVEGPIHTEALSARAADPATWSDWAQLVEQASEPNCFAEPWFIRISLAHLAREAEVRLVSVRRAGNLIGILPLATSWGYGRIPVPFTQNWCHHHMFLGTPTIRAGAEKSFWTGIIGHLDEAGWAPSFLHVRGLVEEGPVHRGLEEASVELGRSAEIVHRRIRAFLQSDLSPEAYYASAVRPKKRKELRRLRTRLAELGEVRLNRLEQESQLDEYCTHYLKLEKAGWKGRSGSALACTSQGESWFRDIVRSAFAERRLQFLRLDLDGRPLAMLINLLGAPGSFSFKTCFDEDYARFSPGVLLQIENLDVLNQPEIAWMDSCAVDDHPMIDSLWTERRRIVRVTVPLNGLARRAVHGSCRLAERMMATLKEWKR